MFQASDRIDYDRLKINQTFEPCNPNVRQAKSLVDCACKVINESQELVELVLRRVPCSLAPALLKSAVDSSLPAAVCSLISCWPLKELCFRDIFGAGRRYSDLFEDENGYNFDLMVFKGIVERRSQCKIECVDLRGFKLNQMFSRLIVNMLPILSLKKSQLKPKKLANVITQATGVEEQRLTEEVLENLLERLLDHEIIRMSKARIAIADGKKMVVKIDSLLFYTGNLFFMDYMLSNYLRNITPVYIEVSSLQIRSVLQIGEQTTDSIALFIVLRGQDTQTLDGITLSSLEENLFFSAISDLRRFSNIRFLSIPECSIYLQTGNTRSQTLSRSRLKSLFTCLHKLKRLDISSNYVVGCLGEVLDVLPNRLEYLSISGCDINKDDLSGIARSKHAGSLRELDLSQLTHFSMDDIGCVSQVYLLQALPHFPKLCILNLSLNNLNDACIPELCDVLKESISRLKVLDLSLNALTIESVVTIVRACTQLEIMQKLLVTCADGLLDVPDLPPRRNVDQCEVKQKLLKVLAFSGREDIVVELVKTS